MDEMPCAHIMAAIKKGHMDAYEYCSIYYKKQTYFDTYKGTVNTVENLDEWKISGQVEQIEVEHKLKKRTTGRSKKTRFLLRGEFKKHNIKCGKYGEYGHNKKTYRNHAIVKPKKW